MIGKPKFKLDDIVSFTCNGNGETKTGTVFTVDRFGTFFCKSDVCYDIMVESENCLYKHIEEKYVSKPSESTLHGESISETTED